MTITPSTQPVERWAVPTLHRAALASRVARASRPWFRLWPVACGLWPLLAGCGRPAGPVFPPVDPPIVFPSPPEIARLRYVGQLQSEADLAPAVSGLQALKTAISGPETPRAVSAPAGLAVSPAERAYVADPPLRCVHLFDLNKRTYRALAQAGAEPFVTPADVALIDGRLYVSDAGRAVIDVFSETGEYQTTWRHLSLTRPVGLTAAPAVGRLYVIDAGRHECIGLSLDGRELVRFGGRGDEPGEFNYPMFAAFDERLGLVVADSLNFRIQRFDPDGGFIHAFGRKGDGAGDFALPKGVAVDTRGHLYVSDAHFENIQIFDADGRLLMTFGGEGQQPGQFWLPAKIVIDDRQRLWVADGYNRRVQVFEILEESSGLPQRSEQETDA
jgi:DNA-binding beta-propeller fold protein YncE